MTSNMLKDDWEKSLGEFLSSKNISPRDLEIYRRAFTHRSYHNEYQTPGHNERLEFLGDAVLGLVLSDLLVNTFGEEPEGVLSRKRAALVSETGLNQRAEELDLARWLLLGRGEEVSQTRTNPRIVSGTLEALVGAIYMDLGWPEAFRFVERLFRDHLHSAEVSSGFYGDYKSKLQEDLQRQAQGAPTYRTVKEEGPEHQKMFFVEVQCGDKVLGQGQGASKKQAEQEAAKNALHQLKEIS